MLHCLAVQASEVANKRFVFFVAMWITYVTIVLTSTAVATIRFLMHEDGSLHVFITTTSNHLVSLVQLPALACCCCPGPGSGSSAAYLLHNHQQPPGQGHETGASLCTACCCRTVAAFPGACVNTTTSNHWVRALSIVHLSAQHATLAEPLRSSTSSHLVSLAHLFHCTNC